MSGHVVPVKLYVSVFFALIILTLLTTAVAFWDIGTFHTGIRLLDRIPLNTVVALAIAVTKMLLVVLFFMHLKYSPGLTRLVLLAGFFWLAIMLALTLSDELTRGWSPSPGSWSILLPFLKHIF
ncbi:MAG: cytochrome C oxidase subunit IV family protein [Candidatus Acidiferrales bacterium]